MSLPAFAKEHQRRLHELEAKVKELEKLLEKKKPGRPPKEPNAAN
jgi:hypothetical protein